ncbi:MAG: GrpB family protein, partial [Rubrobacteraceae bacterium]|nr:GrpB family protein [Rubrobacteraceae bacterium]
AKIRAALGEAALSVEHIGSTSVPGLAAKPIVDVLLVVEDSGDEASYLPALEEAGYVLRVREPDFDEHRMFRTPEKDVHVHVFSSGSLEIERYLLLRDRLREDQGDRELYARTKRDLAGRDWPSMQHYAEAKTEVIEGIVARAIARRSSRED